MMRSAWAFVPTLGGALVHAPILRYDLVRSLKLPLDGGAAPGGRRLLGDNKTVRGAVAMAGGTFVATLVLHRLGWYRRRLPDELRAAGPVRHGAALGAGVVLGELPNSVLKRRLGIGPGERGRSTLGTVLAIHDQADFVLGSWPLFLPVWPMSARELAEAFATVAAVHMAVNLAGYALGARTTPI